MVLRSNNQIVIIGSFALDLARDVKGLKLDGFELTWGKGLSDFFTHGIEIEQFENVKISNSVFTPKSEKLFYGLKLSHGSNAVLSGNNISNGDKLIRRENVH